MEGVGVKEGVAAKRECDVAFPEDEITALQAGEADGLAERLLLHVAVARAGDATGMQRDLDEAGAVDAGGGLAAPEVWHVEETLGDGDEIAFVRSQEHH